MTMISRIFGYLRDVVIAVLFGASGSTDAFFVAFRIPNFLRRLFAEGAFSLAFVPVFAEFRERRGQQELKDLVDHVTGTLTLVLSATTAVGILAAPLLIGLFAPGFLEQHDRFDLATRMLRLTFPYLLFISLTALAGGILNSMGRFAIPAFTPVLLNLSLIGAALWLSPYFSEPVTALAWGVLIAGMSQLAFQIPFLWRLGLLPHPRLSRTHEGVRRIMKLMLPALFGTSIVQINLLIDTLIASFLAAGSISWLYYSDRFVELPLALFGIAIATVILPRLSQHHARRSPQAFSQTLDSGLRLSLLVTLPAMLGLILLAGPILVSLIQYRAFALTDSEMARLSLMAYAVGLPGFILIKILAPGYYSRQDTKTPVKIGVVAMLVNIALNAAFVIPWVYLDWPGPHAGLALATSLSSYVNAALLYRGLHRQRIFFPREGWAALIRQILVACALLAACLLSLTPALSQWVAWPAWQRGGVLAGLVALGTTVYVIGLSLQGLTPRRLIAQAGL